MGTVKNLCTQPVGIRCQNGDMLYLQARQEMDVAKIKLDERHVSNMVRKGYITLRGAVVPGKEAEKEKEVKATAEEQPSTKKVKN